MKLKTFIAPNMKDALKIIRQDLGREAIILSTRKIKNDEGKSGLEITAALDEETHTPPVLEAPILKKKLPPFSSQKPKQSKLSACLKHHGLKGDILNILSKASAGLKDAGFSEEDALEMVLSKRIPFQPPEALITKGRAHVFLGPTGAGKTTFITKLAIQLKGSGHKIGLLSLDDQKIAGFEPLRVVANIMSEQAFLLQSKEDLARAGKELGKRNYLFIDTPGLNVYNEESLKTFKKRLDDLGLPLTCHLVLPAGMSIREITTILPQFTRFNPVSCLFTKLDEIGHYGSMAHIALNSSLYIGLVTNSQEPQDAPVPLDATSITKLLLQHPRQPWEATP